MRARIIKGFGYCADGIHPTALVAGGVVDIRDDLAPGLIAEGWIAADDGAASSAASPVDDSPEGAAAETGPADDHAESPGPGTAHGDVRIPDEWRNMHHKKRIALATRISGAPVADKSTADAVIAAELERRVA